MKGVKFVGLEVHAETIAIAIRALTTESKHGHLSDTQRKQVSAELKGMRKDGFDCSAAWRLEENVGAAIFDEVRSSANPAATYQMLMGEPMPNGAGKQIA